MTASSPIIIDGKKVSAQLKGCLKHKVDELVSSSGKRPCLAVCLVGDDAASEVYVRNKEKAAAEVGIDSVTHRLPASTSQEELADLIKKLNEDDAVNGILLQLPLPKGLDSEPILLHINPMKDVDGLHPFNLGMIVAGHPNLVPCTPFGVMRSLKAYGFDVKGMKATVLGRSRLVGKPIAELLINQSATVTVIHSKTRMNDMIDSLKSSDLIVTAIGKPQFVKSKWIKEGAIVIDVGINRLGTGQLVGDVDYEACLPKVKAITPVPGGVGPLTVSHLLLNTVKAFELQNFGDSSIEL